MDIKNFKEKLFEMAKKEGFSEYELFYSTGKSLKVSVFKGELEKFNNSKSGGVSFRGVFNGKMGYSFCEKIDENTIPSLIKYAKENSELINEDEKEEIYAGDKEYKEVKTFYEELEDVQVDEMINGCLEMEKAVLEYDSRIISCNSCTISKSLGETYIANSKGLELKQKGNFIFAYTGALAKENDEVKSGMDIFGGFNFKDFDAKKVGQKASQKALASLGAKSVPSGKYKIIFENECFIDLFSCFIGSFYAENVQKGFSLFKDKLNTKIASDLITISDEPLMENGYNSTSFDSEGVACYNKDIVENGVLKTYIYNLKSAKKDGVKSTGNGFKGGFKGSIGTSVTNFYIKNGNTDFDTMVQNVSNGLLIKDLSGLHSGVNGISGDFSLLAEGFLIENGKITTPVEQITIAGNYFEMMKNIKELASDLKFSTGGIGTPSVFVGELDVAGE